MQINTINARAIKLYEKKENNPDQDIKQWLGEFTQLELAKLWTDYCTYKKDKNDQLVNPACYDDEVYNALNYLGFWDIK